MTDEKKSLPASLKAVGILYVLLGILPILISLSFEGGFHADRNDAMLIIASVCSGIGILRLSSFWRIMGLFLLIVYLIFGGAYFIGLIALINDTPQNEKKDLWITMVLTAATFVLILFMVTTLLRFKIVELFKEKERKRLAGRLKQ